MLCVFVHWLMCYEWSDGDEPGRNRHADVPHGAHMIFTWLMAMVRGGIDLFVVMVGWGAVPVII